MVSIARGELLAYVTYEGIVESNVLNITIIKERVYYELENGDYAVETSSGPVKTAKNETVLEAFGHGTSRS
jgi:hypothetical protein